MKCVAFLFCLISTIANAEPFKVTRPALCDKAVVVLKELIEKFGEKPIWQGKNNQELFTLLLLNPTTETWTIVITDGDLACVIDSGDKFMAHKNSETAKPEPKNLTDL